MLGTYASLVIILGAAAVAGQALFALCGRREWSWLSPAVGIGLLSALAWGAAKLAGDATIGLLVVALATLAALRILSRAGTLPVADQAGLPTLAGAVVLGSIPFLVELRFGILGTSLNPDMSQHLFAADRLGSGGGERLLDEGYPLGPHALVASVSELGLSLVHGFGGLALATAAAASLAPLTVLRDLPVGRRVGGALLVGFAYLAASYLIQGAFKETMQALFLLAFAIGLHELSSARLGGNLPAPRWRRLKAVPLAALAVGSIYAYSFPGLAWLAGAAALWALAEVIRRRGEGPWRRALGPAGIGLAFLIACVAAEVPRALEFASFETFDPDGPGLGNLFGPISPVEALGIWPSGDFRLDAGAGIAPAPLFYLGGLLGVGALLFGLGRSLRRGQSALPAAFVAAALLYLYAVAAGTPYQEAKALVLAAPLAALISVAALLAVTPRVHELRTAAPRTLVLPLASLAFLGAAAGSSALALLNGPVGPSSWSPALSEFNAQLGDEAVLAVVDDELLEQNGYDLVAWELRGRDVCVVSRSDALGGAAPQRSFGAVVVIGELNAPLSLVGRLEEVDRDGEYVLYRSKLAGPEPECPFIADGDRAEPGAQ